MNSYNYCIVAFVVVQETGRAEARAGQQAEGGDGGGVAVHPGSAAPARRPALPSYRDGDTGTGYNNSC